MQGFDRRKEEYALDETLGHSHWRLHCFHDPRDQPRRNCRPPRAVGRETAYQAKRSESPNFRCRQPMKIDRPQNLIVYIVSRLPIRRVLRLWFVALQKLLRNHLFFCMSCKCLLPSRKRVLRSGILKEK